MNNENLFRVYLGCMLIMLILQLYINNFVGVEMINYVAYAFGQSYLLSSFIGRMLRK
jgi:hypothetical protein